MNRIYMTPKRRTKVVYSVVLIAWLLYAVGTVTAPVSDANTAAFPLSETALFFIQLTIVLPYLLVWLFGAFGWTRLMNYTDNIRDHEDGKGLRLLAHGFGLLLLTLVVYNVVGLWQSHHIDDAVELMSATIVLNYIYAIVPLIAFIALKRGALVLYFLIDPKKRKGHGHEFGGISLMLALGACLLYFFFTNDARQVSPVDGVAASYYISDVFALVTIIFPVVLGWVFATLATIRVGLYAKKVQGMVYRSFFRKMALGFGLTTVGFILLQFILILGPARLFSMSLGSILVIIYAFLLMLALGFGLVASGASKLQVIESTNAK